MLPAHLAERVHPVTTPVRPEGRFVVYWMRAALRAFDNPALDVALSLARIHGVPAFVYLGLSASARWANDRHHTFFLESARDVAAQLAARGVGCVVHLEHAQDRAPRLLELARDARAVVTDWVPVTPWTTWDRAVDQAAPLWRVDASCVAPAFRFDTRFEDLAHFRAAAQPAWDEARRTPWRDVDAAHPPFVPELPFTPVDLARAPLPALVASAPIDHTVAPVHHTPGGTAAGEARFEDFVAHHLDAYEAHRQDPLAGATSRLSAYLRVGAVSPFRIAAEPRLQHGPGGARYLEEVLGWRELAWNFCQHVDDTEHLEALPDWARESLKRHEADRRDFLPSFEELARAQTGDPAWDACQRLLVSQGELHTALRVPWAKALVGWTRTAQDALSRLVELNDRYALDARDPLARFGILWCLGAMDAPVRPERPFLGLVRPRPLAELGKKVDLGELGRRARRPSRRHALAVAVVGAGVAGAAAARAIHDAGHAVTVFEAGAAPGGRVGVLPVGEHRVDAGAQDFSADDERFARWVRAWWHERVVAEWLPRVAVLGERRVVRPAQAHRFVGVPSMGAWAPRLLHGLDVRLKAPVEGLARTGEHLKLRGPHDVALGEYDAVVVATPAPEAARLLEAVAWPLATRAREVRFEPEWTLLLEFDQALDLDFDVAEAAVGPVAALHRESSKPGHAAGERWVARARGDWSQRHLAEAPDAVAGALLDAFFAATGAPRVSPVRALAHLWPQARAVTPLGEDCLADDGLRLVVCGDWCLGATVEAAFLSGSAAAGRVNGWRDDDVPAPRATAPAAQLDLL